MYLKLQLRILYTGFRFRGLPDNNLRKSGLITTTEYHVTMDNPRGSQWSNNSCAFDAVLSVLYNIWLDNTQERTVQLKDINNEYLEQVVNSFLQIRPQGYTLEEVHDFMWLHLQTADPAAFPWGRYTGIQYILDYLLSANRSVTSSTLRCPNGHLLHRANLNHR